LIFSSKIRLTRN